MYSYDHPFQVTYKFPAAALSGGAATFGRFIGPKGKTGRLLSLTTINTTGVTVASATVIVGAAGVYGTVTVPISAINLGLSATDAQIKAATLIPADTVITVGTSGAATAGAVDVTISVGWF